MSYSFQAFAVGQVLTAAQMDQVEANIRDHQHGVSGVLNVGTTAAVDNNSTTLATTAFVLAQAATQAQQETGSSVINFVTPGRQKFHPSASKGWAKFDAAGSIQQSYGVTSITDSAVGKAVVTWTTPFSAATYAVILGIQAQNSYSVMIDNSAVTPQSVGDVYLLTVTGADAAVDPNYWHVAAYGDQ